MGILTPDELVGETTTASVETVAENYVAERFAVNGSDEVCSIRRHAFHGNGLLQSISLNQLEDLFIAGAAWQRERHDDE